MELLGHTSPEMTLFTLPWSFIRIATNGGAGLRNKFRAAALDEVAGFGDDILEHFDELPDARLAIDDFSG